MCLAILSIPCCVMEETAHKHIYGVVINFGGPMSAPAAEVITIPVMVRHRGVFCIVYGNNHCSNFCMNTRNCFSIYLSYGGIRLNKSTGCLSKCMQLHKLHKI